MNMTRRTFLKMTGLSAGAYFISTFTTSCHRSRKRPNILFIMSDDHAERAISCYCKDLIQTPNIDRIATEGIRFNNSFVTNSICAPSRAVLLTGKYSHMNGLRDNRDEFDGSQMTFPKLLRADGYETFMIGKWHLKTDPTGFDDWQVLIGQGDYYNPVFNENGEKKQYEGYTTDLITDKAIHSLDNRDLNKPFCLFVHHKAPHRNWMPSTKHLDAFKDKELPVPDTFRDDYDGRPAAEEADMRIDEMFISHDLKLNRGSYDKETGTGGSASSADKAPEWWDAMLNRLTDNQRKAWDAHYDEVNREYKNAGLSGSKLLNWKYQRYMQDYLGCILSVDENVGRLLNYLDENDLSEDTIVVYTSDQGFYLGEHGWYDKRFMYEESLSMPLVMRYPRKMKAGQISDEMVLNLDFAPTLLDFAGVNIPEEMQGNSFKSIALGKKPDDWRKSMYYHYYEYPHGWHSVRRHYGIRTERYKLIHFYDDPDHWELYDLKQDPHEIKNIYHDPGSSEVVSDLKRQLVALQQRYGDSIQ